MTNMPSFVSGAMKVRRWLKKGCVTWIIVIGEKETNRVSIHKVPIANEFLDDFPEELLGLQLDLIT